MLHSVTRTGASPSFAPFATTTNGRSKIQCNARSSSHHEHSSLHFVSRRSALTAASLLVLPQLPSLAADDTPSSASSTGIYTDPRDGFSLQVPAGWLQGEGSGLGGLDPSDARSRYSNAAGLQRVIAWVPPSTSDVNLAVTVRTPAADFTSLGSFGTAQQWAESLVASMDRSYLARFKRSGRDAMGGGDPVTIATLLDVKEGSGPSYIVKYKVAREGSPTRVVVSAVALGVSPTGLRRFYTINGSATEETEGKFGEVLKQAVESFSVPPMQ